MIAKSRSSPATKTSATTAYNATNTAQYAYDTAAVWFEGVAIPAEESHDTGWVALPAGDYLADQEA